MKRIIIIFGFLLALSSVAQAQVTKEVEVTKNYVPDVSPASKLPVEPNMVDTVMLRPDMDYSITPRSFSSSLGMHRFKPASVTYWEYGRRYPFYIKLGAGYPLNSVADIYATSHRADVGFVMGYLNHKGQYSNIGIRDLFDGAFYKNNSQQMVNRVGVNAGKYFGRYTLEGDVSYRSDIYHRYPLDTDYDRREVNFEDIDFKLRFGDSFSDLSRVNFDVYAAANFCNDKSDTFIDGAKYQQIDASAGVRVARKLARRSTLSASVDYRGYFGLRDLSSYDNNILSATLMYGYNSGRLLDLKVGLTYFYDHLSGADRGAQHRFLPHIYVGLNLKNRGAFVPYVEVDGMLENNSFYSLLKRNPYIAELGPDGTGPNPSLSFDNTLTYNLRFGISGHTTNSKFAYRFFANMAFVEDALYWYNVNQIFFSAVQARENIWSLNAEVDYKPVSQLLINFRLRGMIYTNFSDISDCKPPVEAMLKIRYTHRKFSVRASADLKGVSKWTSFADPTFVGRDAAFDVPVLRDIITVPTTVDVGLGFDWYVSKKCTIFIEGNNLANMNIYNWVFYREYGASFTAGVKIQF